MKQAIKEVPKWLKYLFFCSLAIILTLDLCLFDMKPIFPKAFEIATLLHKISSSLLSGILIFFFSQQYPKILKRKERDRFLNNAIATQKTLARDILVTLYKQNNRQFVDNLNPPSKEVALNLAKITNPRNKVQFFGNYVEYENWYYLLEHIKNETNEFCKILFMHSDILSSATVAEVGDCYNYINFLFNPTTAQSNMGNRDLEFAMGHVFDLIEVCYRLPTVYKS